LATPESSASIRSLIDGAPLDSPPILLWKHFRTDQPNQLAHQTVEFYRRYRLAAAKIMPDIPLLFEDFALSSFAQLAQLRRFGAVSEVGRAAEYIRTVELTRAQLDKDDVLLVTLFSPLGLIGLWSGPTGLRQMADGDRAVAHEVLWALAGLVSQLARACVEAGADGVYYSCWGQDVLTEMEYLELGVPYDLAGLRGAAAAEFQLLHVHGALDQAVERYAGYPVQVVGWSEAESAVTLPEGAGSLPGKFVMGGISELWRMGSEKSDGARLNQLRELLGPAFVAAPGCSLPDQITDDALANLRQLVEQPKPK
jgi:uroporphyrinogen decarboxylase